MEIVAIGKDVGALMLISHDPHGLGVDLERVQLRTGWVRKSHKKVVFMTLNLRNCIVI